jgi:hypothetical protein
MTEDEVLKIFTQICETKSDRILLNLQSKKGDLLVINTNHLAALYATPVNMENENENEKKNSIL